MRAGWCGVPRAIRACAQRTLDAPAMADPVASLDDGDSEAFALSDDWLYFAARGEAVASQFCRTVRRSRWRLAERQSTPPAPVLRWGPEGQLAVAGAPRVSMDLMIVTPGDGSR
jgi:hypothetical protein